MAAIIKFILSQCSFSIPLADVRKPKCSFFMTRKWYIVIQHYQTEDQAEEKRLLSHTCILIALLMIYIIDEIL